MRRIGDTAPLIALFLFGLLAVAGYATFGRQPDLLASLPPALAGVYPAAFRFFAQGQVWLAAVVLLGWLGWRAGARWVPALLIAYGISLGSELLGTMWGVPFGEYAYDAALGPMWLDRVPWIIPLSWFLMALPSYALARAAYPTRERTVARIALASLLLLTWDLSLDPAMSHATRYWRWAEAGPYYGMPLLNLFGWCVTGLALMLAFVAARADRWIARLPVRWLAAYYAGNLLVPFGMCVAAGLSGAVVATVGVLGVAGWWTKAAVVRRAARELSASRLVEVAR